MAYTMSEAALKARRKGGRARAKQFTTEHQQAAGRVRGNSMTPEEHSILGRAGYKAMVNKYGRDRAIELVKNYQLANPSSLEKIAAEIFTRLGLAYESQVQIFNDRGILVDFLVSGVYIDIQGYWHDHSERAMARDAYVASRLEREGRRYLALHHTEQDQWEQQIKANLGIEP